MNGMKPTVLCIMDGWGIDTAGNFNAITQANTPNYDYLIENYCSAKLSAHGAAVGLPQKQMGNSEVGHTTIGSGRISLMNLPKIDLAVSDGSFGKNLELQAFIKKLKSLNGTAHLAGLVSDGGVHSHQSHLAEAANLIHKCGVPVKLHCFLDGRDVPPQSALNFVSGLQRNLSKGVAIATLTGRFYAMDRDNRWDRIETAYNAIIFGKGTPHCDPCTAIRAAYSDGESDEFISPRVISEYNGVKIKCDGLFFLNFRADRARELLSAFVQPNFKKFKVEHISPFSCSLGLIEYSKNLSANIGAMFKSEKIINCLGEWLSKNGKRQFRIAETEKYPHVTFFFNGGNENPYPGEVRCLVPSPKVSTYDLCPEMSSLEVTSKLVKAIESGKYEFIVVNYANPDMVGHSGKIKATVSACEAVDRGLGKILTSLRKVGGQLLLTSDHGNSETMLDEKSGLPHTAHTINRVPIIYFSSEKKLNIMDGTLSDIAPTILQLMGLEKPIEMTGKSLIKL